MKSLCLIMRLLQMQIRDSVSQRTPLRHTFPRRQVVAVRIRTSRQERPRQGQAVSIESRRLGRSTTALHSQHATHAHAVASMCESDHIVRLGIDASLNGRVDGRCHRLSLSSRF